jgi:reactive intermediate/imine deaminase
MKTKKIYSGLTMLILFLPLGFYWGCSRNQQEITFFPQENSSYPFSKAVRAGDIIFVSGMIGTDKSGGLDPDFKVQAKQTMENIREKLGELGLNMKDIVKCTVMIHDMSKWSDFNEIYKTYFVEGRFPARSAFGVAALALGAEMEVEVVACSHKMGK